MKKEYVPPLVILATAALLFANAYVDYNNRNVVSFDMVYGGHGDWKYYESLSELTSDSDLVISGRVVDYSSRKIQVTELDVAGKNMKVTEFTISINEVLYGKVDSKQITVYQTGCYDNLKTQLTEHPMLSNESELLLFLTKVETGGYSMTGGPQGHFEIKDGKVYSIGEINTRAEETTSGVRQEGKLLDTLALSIE